MYRTLLGEKGFKDGMKLYFKRHDGGAVTCDDFRAAMAGRLVYNHQPVWVTDLYSTVPTSSHPFRHTLRCRLLSSWELYSTLLYSTRCILLFYSVLSLLDPSCQPYYFITTSYTGINSAFGKPQKPHIFVFSLLKKTESDLNMKLLRFTERTTIYIRLKWNNHQSTCCTV